MGAVRDGLIPGTDIAYSTSAKVVAANWDVFAANRKDPVVNYAWAVGTAAGLDNVLAFTDIGLVTEIQTTLAPDEPDLEVLKQGTQYFVTVRAFSLSGLGNVGSSNGFYVDTTAPGMFLTSAILFRKSTGRGDVVVTISQLSFV